MSDTPRSDAVFGPRVFGERARTCRQLEKDLNEAAKDRDAAIEELERHSKLIEEISHLIDLPAKALRGGGE